jgi:hypothetical protein
MTKPKQKRPSEMVFIFFQGKALGLKAIFKVK